MCFVVFYLHKTLSLIFRATIRATPGQNAQFFQCASVGHFPKLFQTLAVLGAIQPFGALAASGCRCFDLSGVAKHARATSMPPQGDPWPAAALCKRIEQTNGRVVGKRKLNV